MYGKKWEKVLNKIFFDDSTLKLKYNVQQSCRAHWALSVH